ncbi:hypothetical protein ILYODFUR_018797 [Ilyodon furcidens]|uniref:Uncharacterized protein n=1 Tax=Ilyodon furcidens TaxID=33524 RepID=A0ABV0TZX7_9TELE
MMKSLSIAAEEPYVDEVRECLHMEEGGSELDHKREVDGRPDVTRWVAAGETEQEVRNGKSYQKHAGQDDNLDVFCWEITREALSVCPSTGRESSSLRLHGLTSSEVRQ